MPIDHDQRFKTLIQTFIEEFFALFYPEYADEFDLKNPEWITTEVFENPPEGSRRYLDLLAKVGIKNPELVHPGHAESTLALIHVEIESKDQTTTAVKQLWDNHVILRKKYGLGVLPVALFLNVGRNGIAVEEYHETIGTLNTVTFRYLSVGLPRLNAIEYLQQDNMLGVALTPFMDIPDDQVLEFGNEALLKVCNAANLTEQQRYLLAECIQKYLPLLPEDQARFDELQGTPRYIGVKAMNLTWEEKGIIKGIIKGKIEGKIEGLLEVVEDQLTLKFGELPERVHERLKQLTLPELRDVSRKLLAATSLDELGLE